MEGILHGDSSNFLSLSVIYGNEFGGEVFGVGRVHLANTERTTVFVVRDDQSGVACV